MTLREWCDAHPRGEMQGLRLAGPTGTPWTLGTAWRVGRDEPPIIGMFLHAGDATEGKVEFFTTPFDAWMDDWMVR